MLSSPSHVGRDFSSGSFPRSDDASFIFSGYYGYEADVRLTNILPARGMVVGLLLRVLAIKYRLATMVDGDVVVEVCFLGFRVVPVVS